MSEQVRIPEEKEKESSGLATQMAELEDKEIIADHHRRERTDNAINSILIWSLRAMGVVIVLSIVCIGATLIMHYFGPSQFHWLTEAQRQKIEGAGVGVVIAISIRGIQSVLARLPGARRQ